MKKVLISIAFLSVSVVQAQQIGTPFAQKGIRLQMEDILDEYASPNVIEAWVLPGTFAIDGVRLQRLNYAERRVHFYGVDGSQYAPSVITRIIHADDGQTDTLKTFQKTDAGEEYFRGKYDIYGYSDDRIRYCIQYDPDYMPDSLGSWREYFFEYDDLGRVKSWKRCNYGMYQDWSSIPGYIYNRNGYPDLVDGYPIWRELRWAVQTTYDYSTNDITINYEGIAPDGWSGGQRVIHVYDTDQESTAERRDANSHLIDAATYVFDEKERLTQASGSWLHSLYTYFDDGFHVKTISGSGQVTGEAEYRFNENGLLSERRSPAVVGFLSRHVYEYIGLDGNPPDGNSPITAPASDGVALSAVPDGLRLRLATPASVEVFRPTGQRQLSRQVSGEVTLPLPSGIYFVRIDRQTHRTVVR